MNAKEYLEKFFSTLTIQTSQEDYKEMALKCFTAFNKELQEQVGHITLSQPQISTIKEYQKKWREIVSIVDRKSTMLKNTFQLYLLYDLFDDELRHSNPEIYLSILS